MARRRQGHRFRLYHSPSAAIVATPATRVTSAAGSIELDVFVGALPAAAAARFKYLGDGPVLAVKDADLARMPSHREQLVLVQETADGTVHSATRLQVAGALDDIYADKRAASAGYDSASGTYSIPPRTAVVFVAD